MIESDEEEEHRQSIVRGLSTVFIEELGSSSGEEGPRKKKDREKVDEEWEETVQNYHDSSNMEVEAAAH